MRFKRGLTRLMTLVLAVSLAACGVNNSDEASPNSSGGSETENGQEPVTLRMMWWGSQTRHDATLKAIELYQKLNPHVTIKAEYSGWGGYWDKLATLFAAQNAPDLFQMDISYLGDYANRNQLADLSDVDVSQIAPNLMETSIVNGKTVALPAGNGSYGIVYNKEIFTQYGIEEPKEGWTWDDLFQGIRDSKGKLPKGVYLTPDFSAGELEYQSYQLSQGKGSLYVDNKLNMDKDTWLEWSKIWNDFRKEGLVAPANQTITDVELDAQFDLLVKGTVLMRGTHAAQVGAFDSLMPGKIGVATFPQAKESGSWLKPTCYFSVNSNSKNVEESKKFLHWMLTDVEAGKILKTERGIPVTDDVMTAIQGGLSSADLLGKEMTEKITKNSQPFAAQPPGYNDFGKDMMTTIQSVLFGKVTPEQAYDEIQKLAVDTEASLN